MKKQRWFKREIFERFLSEKELAKLEAAYNKAKIVNLGREAAGV